ncbi:MAG: phosphoadenylyl-sulfate reductase [Spirochaetota bacterium]
MSDARRDQEKRLGEFREQTAGLSAAEVLRWAASTFGERLTVASSLGAEDQVLAHMISAANLGIPVFTLDTGRMFNESYELMSATQRELGIKIRPYFPDASQVEQMVAERGINLFYDSVELRKRCCHVRKVEPLRRALAGKEAWITGLRRSQSVTRSSLGTIEWDEQNELVKISPLAEWSEDVVWEYIRANAVPYNELHDRGFPSIGCAPCTRAVEPGADPRSGRWWWEQPEHRECGLHTAGAQESDRPAGKVEVGRLGLS